MDNDGGSTAPMRCSNAKHLLFTRTAGRTTLFFSPLFFLFPFPFLFHAVFSYRASLYHKGPESFPEQSISNMSLMQVPTYQDRTCMLQCMCLCVCVFVCVCVVYS